MRKLILSILLVGVAATPAIAQDHGRWRQNQEQSDAQPDGRQAAREARQEQREQAREQRQQSEPQQQVQVDRSQRFEMRQQQSSDQSRGDWARSRLGGEVNSAPEQAVEQQQWQRRGGFEGRRFDGGANAQADVQAQQQQQQQWQRRDGSRWTRDRSNWTGNRDDQSGSWSRDAQSGTWQRGDLRQGDRPTPNVMRDRNPTIVNDPRYQTQTRTGTWSGRTWTQNNTRWSGTWNRDWRNDRRYDWRRYRNSHRSIFHIGIYFDPFGYNYYRPLSIGYRIQPYYYGEQYWIDPALYNLPYPPPGTMWVRYWNDALLVDTYTGEVVDVIRDFFW